MKLIYGDVYSTLLESTTLQNYSRSYLSRIVDNLFYTQWKLEKETPSWSSSVYFDSRPAGVDEPLFKKGEYCYPIFSKKAKDYEDSPHIKPFKKDYEDSALTKTVKIEIFHNRNRPIYPYTLSVSSEYYSTAHVQFNFEDFSSCEEKLDEIKQIIHSDYQERWADIQKKIDRLQSFIDLKSMK